MPAPLAPILGFILGIAFAWSGREELARSQAAFIGSRSLIIATLFGAIVSNKMMSRDRRDQSKPLDTSTCGTAIAWITTRWLQPAISSHL